MTRDKKKYNDFQVFYLGLKDKDDGSATVKVSRIASITEWLCTYIRRYGCFAHYTLRYGFYAYIKIGFPTWMSDDEKSVVVTTIKELADDSDARTANKLIDLLNSEGNIIGEEDEEKESV